MPLFLPMDRLDLEKPTPWKVISMMKQELMKELENPLFRKKIIMESLSELLEKFLTKLRKVKVIR